MNEKLFLLNFSPIKILSIGSLAGLFLIACLTYLTLQQPWLGIHIKYQPGKYALMIEGIDKNSPAENIGMAA